MPVSEEPTGCSVECVIHGPCVFLLSGGLDSTTCLYLMRDAFSRTVAVSFDYGQRHSRELEAAERIAGMAEVDYRVLSADLGSHPEACALLDDKLPLLDETEELLPNSFVPGRNLLLLTKAAMFGVAHFGIDVLRKRGGDLKCLNLVTGVNQQDFSGYPDCRSTFIRAAELALTLALDIEVVIHAPLQHMKKSEIVELAHNTPGCWEAVRHTVSCYAGVFGGCGKCPSCLLRTKGFYGTPYEDPAKELAEILRGEEVFDEEAPEPRPGS